MTSIEKGADSCTGGDIVSQMDRITLDGSHGAPVIAISGLSGGSGKSSTALNLASTLALCGKKAVLIDFSFGSLSICDSLGLAKPILTLSDFLSGEIGSIAKALTPSPYKNLYFIDSGMEYLDFGKKSANPVSKIMKSLSNMEVDYIFIDLGLITDKNKMDIFLSANLPLLVLEPSCNAQNLVQNFAKSMLLRSVEMEFSRSINFKHILDKFMENFDSIDDTLINVLTECVKNDKRNLKKVKKLAKKSRLCIAINRALSKEDISLGLTLKETISTKIGIGASYLGFLPEDDVIFDATGAKRPAPYYEVYTPIAEAFRSLARNITGLESINVDEEALISIQQKLEKFEQCKEIANKQELSWSIEELKRQMESDLENEIREQKKKIEGELANLRERKLADLKDEIEKESAPLRREALGEVEEARQTGLERVNKEILEIENDRLANVNEWTREMKRDEFKQFKSKLIGLRKKKLDELGQKWDSTQEKKFEKLNLEIESRREELVRELENDRNVQKLALAEEMEKISEHHRKEVRARTAKEVEPVRQLVWKELEEDRVKKISSIKEEVSRFRATEMDIVESEMAELKETLKEKLGTEVDIQRNTLLEDAHIEVMRLSSVFDTENARRLSQMKNHLALKYQAEQEKFYNKLQSELAQFRESKTREVTNQIETDRKRRIANLESSIATYGKEKMGKALQGLKKRIISEKEKVAKAISNHRAKSMEMVKLEREKLLAQTEKEVLVIKNQKLDSVREEARRLYDRLTQKALLALKEKENEEISSFQRAMESYKNEKRFTLKTALMEARRSKVEEVTAKIAVKRQEMLDDLNDELARTKSKMLSHMEAESNKTRVRLNEEVEIEIAKTLKARHSDLASEISQEHQNRLKAVIESVRTEELAMRERLHEIMYDEEKTVRNRMLREVDAERKEVLAELMAGMKPQKIRLAMEIKKDIDIKRNEAFQQLRHEVDQLRNQHLDKLKEWENAEKSEMIARMESRLARKETAKLKLIEKDLAGWRKSAMERENVLLDNHKKVALEKMREILEQQKQEQILLVKNDITEESVTLHNEAKAMAEKEREAMFVKLAEAGAEQETLKMKELDHAISIKRNELMKECEAQIDNTRIKQLETLRKEMETQDAAMQKTLDDKRKKLWDQNREWVQMDIDQMRLSLKSKMAEELETLRRKKRGELEKHITSEADAILKRTRKEAGYEKNRLERLIRAEVEKNRDTIKAEARKTIENEVAGKLEEMNKSIEERRAAMQMEAKEYLDKEKKRGLEAIGEKLDSEEKKRLRMMEVELKTEELKRRQDLMDKMMKKRDELEESFKGEKQRYLDKLRDEMSKNPFTNRSSFDKEMAKISKNWRMMN